VTLNQKESWVRYNKVDFSKPALKTVTVNGLTANGCSIEIRMNELNGPVMAKIKIEKTTDWQQFESNLEKFQPGVHDLFVVNKSSTPMEIDWIQFE
jgi:aspartyl-tRNA synthetase